MSDTTMAVRSRLKIILSEHNTARVKAGLQPRTVRSLAEEIELSPSVITGLTANRARRVDFKTMDKLCRALDITPGDLFEYTPDTPTND
jgi:putative transcriptional regulator